MPTNEIPGVLVVCDPSIKSVIMKIDAEDHAFVVEDLDDETVVVKETMVNLLKQRLKDVSVEISMRQRYFRLILCST